LKVKHSLVGLKSKTSLAVNAPQAPFAKGVAAGGVAQLVIQVIGANATRESVVDADGGLANIGTSSFQPV
jgi:hypothetical protein